MGVIKKMIQPFFIIYPSSYFNGKKIEEEYQNEYDASNGLFQSALYDYEKWQLILPNLKTADGQYWKQETAAYRQCRTGRICGNTIHSCIQRLQEAIKETQKKTFSAFPLPP